MRRAQTTDLRSLGVASTTINDALTLKPRATSDDDDVPAGRTAALAATSISRSSPFLHSSVARTEHHHIRFNSRFPVNLDEPVFRLDPCSSASSGRKRLGMMSGRGFIRGCLPFLSPSQQCQRTEGQTEHTPQPLSFVHLQTLAEGALLYAVSLTTWGVLSRGSMLI